MISRQDLFLLLSDLQDDGVNIDACVERLALTDGIDIETIQFINKTRNIELCKFYEKLRKSYNDKKSKLYINIVKEDFSKPDVVLTTLSSLLTQIILFSKGVEDRDMFLRHSRAQEITKVLTLYFRDYDLSKAIKLLQIIKADLKVLENSK